MSNDDEEMEQNRQKEIEQRRREKIEKELFNESLSTEKDRLKAAMDKIARTIDPINWQKPDRGYKFEHNDWRRNMPLLLTTIQELEAKGYQVENCFALNQYPIFAREARLSSYVGFLNRANAHEYGCHNDMGKYIQPLGMRPVANLPNILQGEPAQVQSVEPGSTLAANFGPPVIVNHALLNGINFTLLYYRAQPALRYVHYKGGQLIGFCPKQKPEFIYVTDDKTPYIYLSELDNIFRPQGINQALVPVATLEHDYLAHYLPLAHMTAVWQNVHQAGLEDRMKFLGFAKGQPEAINVETDYYYTLGRPNAPSYPDYPMGLPFYAYRKNKKPKDPVSKTAEELDELRPVALIQMLQERQVDFRCRWSKEDGMFALYDNHAKEGGLVLVGDNDNLYRWDGARNYLERHMTVNEMIQRHDEAKTRAQAKAEADRLASEAKAEAKARKALKSRKVTKAEKETDASSSTPAPEPQVAAKQFTITGGAFGKATFFVKEKDGAANAGNPLSWPIGSQQEIDDKKYRLNSAWGNIEVEHDPGKMVESFRFYNKVHQRNCYAYSVANVSGSLSLPLPSIIWEYERDKKQEEELSLRFGYKRKQVIGSTENDVTTTVTSTSGLNLVAVGAANRTSVSAYDTSNIEKQSDSTKGLVVLKGTKLEELLRGASSECKTADLLARSPESYDKATMWKLTRDIADESSSALPIRDIGIRTFSNDVEIFAGNKSQEEKTLLSRNQLVRFFVALVPDDKDSDKHEHSDINVVSVQDVHPVDGELHIVYLLHHKGEFYSQQIYSSVILLLFNYLAFSSTGSYSSTRTQS
ncbi:hypothetical protein HDE_03534 [Halotydeus destructor]|nr:hypothetical protein HDE_03534 [Halotydeus destructor]